MEPTPEAVASARDALAGLVAAGSPEPVFAGTRVVSVEAAPHNQVEVRLALDAAAASQWKAGKRSLDDLSHALDEALAPLSISGALVLVKHPGTGEFVGIDTLVPRATWALPAVPVSPTEPGRSSYYPRPSGGRPVGALTGRVVYLNPGHGWTWRGGDYWGTQRPFVFNNIEDVSNADLVHQWMIAYLYRAGADVFSVREMDPNPNLEIVDNDDGAPDYLETGAWSTMAEPGFENGHLPYVQGEDPFSFGTQRSTACVVGVPTASATFVPTIPASGYFNVYVSYQANATRSPQAHYRITHAGGDTDYYIDQRRYGSTWIFAGRYYFEAGMNANAAKVVLLNDSTSATHTVGADAVRFGGGPGIIARGTVGTSPYKAHDNDSVYHQQFMGAPASLYANSSDDEFSSLNSRVDFARWLEEKSVAFGAPPLPAVYLSSHTNAATGSSQGTISYLYTTAVGTIHDRFRSDVHNQVIRNLQTGYGMSYTQNGNPLRTGYYYEGNPNNLNQPGYQTVPIFLGEWMFHDNAADMVLYHDPKFRQHLARGVCQGIVDYWADEVGAPRVYLPEPPQRLRVVVDSPTQVTVSWVAPLVGPTKAYGDAATGYRVYRSTHGRGFANPTDTTTTSATFAGLAPGSTHYFQVTATNAGGESFPTETLAARLPVAADAPRVLVVNGYDKVDIETRVAEPFSGDLLYRHYLDRMNTQDFIVEHGRAIDATGQEVAVDSAEHDLVEANGVALAGYSAVIWIGGLQAERSTADPLNDSALKTNTRTALAGYLNTGGRLFLSSAGVGWDLNRLNQQAYQSTTLRSAYLAEASQTAAVPEAGGVFAGLPTLGFGGTGAVYPVALPDILNTSNGSTVALRYDAVSSVLPLDRFETLGGWQQPSVAADTNADSSTLAIVASPVHEGAGAARLNYVWSVGSTTIRLLNTALPVFTASSDFGLWVHGDGSGHQVRVALRDGDGDRFVTDWLTVDFVGWQQIEWNNVIANPKNLQQKVGNGLLGGPNVRLDSIFVQRNAAGPTNGSLYFDDATFTPLAGDGGPPIAAIQYSTATTRVLYMGFPFETINDASLRTQVMDRALDFLLEPPPPTDGMRVY